MRLTIKLFCRGALSFSACALAMAPCDAQNQNLEQLLDKVDPAGAVTLPSVNPGAYNAAAVPQSLPSTQSSYSGGAPIGFAPVSPLQRAMQFFGSNGGRSSASQQGLQSLGQSSGQATGQATGPLQGQSQSVGGRGLFKTLFGPDTSGAGDGSDNMYRAESQASVARRACSRSYYGDYYTRSQAADEAYYAAGEARREADAASAKAASGVANAQSNASAARSYAEAAQASADTARANADRAWK